MSWRAQLRAAAESDALALGLTAKEYQAILELLGRAPNVVELGVFSAMWSEHCSYKTSKTFLKRLPTTGPSVAVGPGENAGAVRLENGYVAVFKMESHNHPSAIEPFNGAATGVGGILRDVFTMGARPIANLDVLFFGARNDPQTSFLRDGVVAGVAFYGNCVGVPTVGGQTTFHPGYHNNILVNAMTVGIAREDELFFGRATGPGNLLVIFGNPTGPDGVHGASMASQVFDSTKEKERPTVQMADPFREKLLLEATLELMKERVPLGIQDMGAAGIVSSSVEMAHRAGTGVRLDLDRVPVRATTGVVTPFERLLSESQERMLMVLTPQRLKDAERILKKWELPFAVIGEVTSTGRWDCFFEGEQVTSLSLQALAAEAPPRATLRKAPEKTTTTPLPKSKPYSWEKFEADAKRVLFSEACAGRRAVFERYDHMVGLRTVLGPGHGAAVLRPHLDEGAMKRSISVTAGVNSRWCAIDPYWGTAGNLLRHVQRHRAVGARALGVTDCLNFGNPEDPEVLWSLEQCLEGLGEASRQLGAPIVSGNVSLYNTTDTHHIPPTPALGVVGMTEYDAVTPSLVWEPGLLLSRVRIEGSPSLAGSWLLHSLQQEQSFPELSWEQEKDLLACISEWQRDEKLVACRAVGAGGLLGTVSAMLISEDSFHEGSVLGVSWEESWMESVFSSSEDNARALLFGEWQAGFLCATREPLTRVPTGFVVEHVGRVVKEPGWSVGKRPLPSLDGLETFLKECLRCS